MRTQKESLKHLILVALTLVISSGRALATDMQDIESFLRAGPGIADSTLSGVLCSVQSANSTSGREQHACRIERRERGHKNNSCSVVADQRGQKTIIFEALDDEGRLLDDANAPKKIRVRYNNQAVTEIAAIGNTYAFGRDSRQNGFIWSDDSLRKAYKVTCASYFSKISDAAGNSFNEEY